MAIRVPDMNPIRWFKPSQNPDYINNWPTDYNTQQFVDYYPGINATKFLKDFVKNKQISNQIGVYTGTVIFRVYKLNDSKVFEQYEDITGTEITPSGYISESIFKYDWIPTEAGVYYIEIVGEDFESDRFIVQDRDKFKRRLIEVEYWNSYNDFGMIFDDDGEIVYKGLTYFEGQLIEGDLTNEISGYDTDRGRFAKTRSTPTNTYIAKIFKLLKSYQRNINTIFSCDNILVNGLKLNNDEQPAKDLIQNSDLANFEVNLKEVEITYSYK